MNDKKLNKILDLIIEEFKPKRVILYGSKGKNIYSYNSDYDIAVNVSKVNFRTKRKILERIEEIIGLHKINLIYLNEVDKDFTNIILKTGKIIYER